MLTKRLISELGIQGKNNVLKREYERCLDRRTMLEIELGLQNKYDPKEMSATRVLSRDTTGRPTSSKTISRAEYIKDLESDLQKVNDLIEVIEKLFEE